MPEPFWPVLSNYALDEALLLKIPEAAERLRLSPATTKRLIRSGDLASVLVGTARRVPLADLVDFVERLRAGATTDLGGQA